VKNNNLNILRIFYVIFMQLRDCV